MFRPLGRCRWGGEEVVKYDSPKNKIRTWKKKDLSWKKIFIFFLGKPAFFTGSIGSFSGRVTTSNRILEKFQLNEMTTKKKQKVTQKNGDNFITLLGIIGHLSWNTWNIFWDYLGNFQ